MQTKGVMEANKCIKSVLSLKKPAHASCPKPRARRIIAVNKTDSFNVTPIACFATLDLPAPSSFDTLVLQQRFKDYV